MPFGGVGSKLYSKRCTYVENIPRDIKPAFRTDCDLVRKKHPSHRIRHLTVVDVTRLQDGAMSPGSFAVQ